MKSLGVVDAALLLASHPSRGAWIEMSTSWPAPCMMGRSHPSRGAWIEINTTSARTCAGTSHPSRGAWIEIYGKEQYPAHCVVAPLTGCVD